MPIITEVTEDEVHDVLNKCLDIADEVGSVYPGSSYEQGVEAALNWIMGDSERPITYE